MSKYHIEIIASQYENVEAKSAEITSFRIVAFVLNPVKIILHVMLFRCPKISGNIQKHLLCKLLEALGEINKKMWKFAALSLRSREYSNDIKFLIKAFLYIYRKWQEIGQSVLEIG